MRLSTFGLFTMSALTVSALGVSTALADTVTVQPGQSLWSIGQSHGVTLQDMMAANPTLSASNLSIGTQVTVPTSNNRYVVQSGDTFWSIANHFGIRVDNLTASNPSITPSTLQPGDTLTIPGAQSSAPASGSTSGSTGIDAQNLYWMERVVNAEAGGETLNAQIAVGDVILHRMQAGSYGSTVHDVVFQITNGHYQFESVANGYIYTAPNASSIQAAQDVLGQGQDLVPGAMVFYNPSMTPSSSWVRLQPTITQIGALVFAK